MAAGGIVFTGSTGEDYSVVGHGALMLDTDNPDQIVLHILNLRDHPERSLAMRQAARQVAAQLTWDAVLNVLLSKVALAACEQGVIQLNRPSAPRTRPVHDVVIASPKPMGLPLGSAT